MSKRPIGQSTPTVTELEAQLEEAEQRVQELIDSRCDLKANEIHDKQRIKELEAQLVDEIDSYGDLLLELAELEDIEVPCLKEQLRKLREYAVHKDCRFHDIGECGCGLAELLSEIKG